MAIADNNRALRALTTAAADCPAMDYDGSTPLPEVRHELFVSGILQGMPDGKAYAAAGFKPRRSSASILRHKPHIIARLAYRRAQLAEHLAVTEERVIAELAKVAFSNMQDFVGSDGDGQFVFRAWDGLSRDQLAAVEAVTVTRETRVNKKGTETQSQQTRFSLHRKLDALEQLGKNLGLFEADNRQKPGQVQHVVVNYNDVKIAHTSGNGSG